MKSTMLQAFEWYLPADGKQWDRISRFMPELSACGITHIWLPPAYKGQAGMYDVGYGVYDMYDIGEFDQKGSISTKYGTIETYKRCIRKAYELGIQIIADIVFNHRMGADQKETIKATEQNWDNRNESISNLETVDVWTKYTFPGRHKKYSSFEWDWTCFDGTDFNAKINKPELLEFNGKQWDQNVSKEKGNFDYIMGDDLDFNNKRVVKELYDWGKWYYEMFKIDGYRLDAVKSIDSHFFKGWLDQQRNLSNKETFAVGEYWSGDIHELDKYLRDCEYCMSLFDVPFHFHLQQASQSNGKYDLRTIFQNTLWDWHKNNSVVFVDNHDTQPGQALQSWVLPWFRLHAYAYILLRDHPMPCVFYGDLYGIPHDKVTPIKNLKELIWIRRNILGDTIQDKWDDTYAVGWINEGKNPVVVVLTIGQGISKTFCIKNKKNEIFVDVVNSGKEVQLNENGEGIFTCADGSCSVYIEKNMYNNMREEIRKK